MKSLDLGSELDYDIDGPVNKKIRLSENLTQMAFGNKRNGSLEKSTVNEDYAALNKMVFLI